MNRLNFTSTETMASTWAKAIRAGMLAAVVFTAAQAQGWEVDPSCPAYSFTGSHHYKHFTGGAVIGAVAYEGLAVVTDSRMARYSGAFLASAAAGIEYEEYHASAGTLKDPADAAWTALGGLAGAGLADVTNSIVSACASKDCASLSVAFRF